MTRFIFDCFDGTLIRYFKEVSNFKIETPRHDPLTIPQIIDNIWRDIDRDYHTNVMVKRLRRIERFGRFESAQDYLAAFARFVRKNEDRIAAIKILLERPREWRPQALLELRRTLRQSEFDESLLRRAYGAIYHKELADIISMIKRAISVQEPIFTAEERVRKAMNEIRAGHEFFEEQMQWLGYIEQHLIGNLSIDAEDMEEQPIFAGRGGLGRARKLFGDQLPALIDELNLAVAAAGKAA